VGSGQRHTPRVAAQRFKFDARRLLADRLDHNGEFESAIAQSGYEFIG
jgi:hypothetical protein